MTAPLSPQERATVERFEQAPDALAEVALTTEQREELAALLPEAGFPDLLDRVAATVARMVAEAADAREAEVRAELSTELANTPAAAAERAGRAAGAAEVRERVEALCDEVDAWADETERHLGPGRIAGRIVRVDRLRAALAPADNDGEASRG